MAHSARSGILALVIACTIWGISPLYYKLLVDVPPLEILTHRTLWSMVIFCLYLGVQKRLPEVGRLMLGRQRLIVLLGAAMISVNWFVFIRSVLNGQAVEASLGYYIFPLVAVVLGMVFFGERLNRWQAAAVSLAAVAVGVLTYGLGVAPWVALVLAGTFGIYAVVKKRLNAGPVASVTAEVAWMAPLALYWLVYLEAGGQGHFGHDLQTSLLLAFAGALTAVPLMLFSYASRRVSMAAFGLTQYLNPSLQFLCATLVFREVFTGWHMIAFALIWVAVAIFAAQTLVQDRARRKAASSAATSSATPM
ncbi:MAG: EamA family transporter RarD [Albidovulum sp.]